MYQKVGITVAEVSSCQGDCSICCAELGWQGLSAQSPKSEDWEVRFWPVAGRLSFFYPPCNNSDNRLTLPNFSSDEPPSASLTHTFKAENSCCCTMFFLDVCSDRQLNPIHISYVGSAWELFHNRKKKKRHRTLRCICFQSGPCMTCSVTKKKNKEQWRSLRHVDDVSLVSTSVHSTDAHTLENTQNDEFNWWFLNQGSQAPDNRRIFTNPPPQKNSSIKAEYLAVEDLNYRDLQCFFQVLLFWKISELFFSFTQITALEGNEKHEGFWPS